MGSVLLGPWGHSLQVTGVTDCCRQGSIPSDLHAEGSLWPLWVDGLEGSRLERGGCFSVQARDDDSVGGYGCGEETTS